MFVHLTRLRKDEARYISSIVTSADATSRQSEKNLTILSVWLARGFWAVSYPWLVGLSGKVNHRRVEPQSENFKLGSSGIRPLFVRPRSMPH